MNNPCKPNCLKYPMCVSRISVKCRKLHNYFIQQTDNGMRATDAWKHIRSFLPKSRHITVGVKEFPINSLIPMPFEVIE